MEALRQLEPIHTETAILFGDNGTMIAKNVSLIVPHETAKQLYFFFANLQTRMKVAGRMNIARWALRQKSKYFQMIKGGEAE
jgi:hypothetical protein